ncbi:MAG: 3-hydroxyacyl-CoA dehydrogenase [bacterium]|nr:3-hydroxyacyl-CoA dehydrogenase [bacterium]
MTTIKRAAVLGSGVMGSAIASHLANAGVPSIMLDILPPDLPEEQKSQPAARNRLAREALNRCLRAKPAPLFDNALAEMIEVGNFDDDLHRIGEVDWIIEVVKEDPEIKRQILTEVARRRRPGSIVSSNTSGLSIAAMAEGLDADFRRCFLGTHFFNPPRYLKLLEIIATPDTDPAVTELLHDFVDRRLGKGVVLAADTPNFVANRVGVFGLLDAITAMIELDLTPEEVDRLTGPLVGRPRSASFRTADLVGLDTFMAVAGNVYHGCPDDEARDLFRTHPLLQKMIEANLLGDKSGGGFYKKSRDERGKRKILTLDLATLKYRDRLKPKFPELESFKLIQDVKKRTAALALGRGRAAEFTWRTLSRLFIYCANRVGEICATPVPIDDGLTWGFGWEVGPFELWDAMGVGQVLKRMKSDGLTPPPWVDAMLAAGGESFYRLQDGSRGVWHPGRGEYETPPVEPGKIRLTYLKQAGAELQGNAGASLIDLGEGVLNLEFHSKMNTIAGDIMGLTNQSLKKMEEGDWAGLVIGNQGENFSVGANLMLVLLEALEGNWEDLNLMIAAFQNTTQAIKYSRKPVVVAPFGLTLGGGAEFTLHGTRARPHAETYIGLVEVGVGVIPAAGGSKELYLRNLEHWDGGDNLIPPLRKTFETIGMAKVATSAVDARNLNFLRATDDVTMNRDRQISDAKATVLGLANAGFDPGSPRMDIPVAGRAGRAVLEAGLFNMLEGNFISAHDRLIGLKLAHVLCGGDLSGTQNVSEQYLLDLEREAFLSLLGERKTLERMQHMLKTGKPLRN